MLRLIKFENDYCEPCKALTPILSALAEEYDIKVDAIDTYTDLGAAFAQKHDVMTTPTVLFANETEILYRIVGLGAFECYEKIIRSLLEV